MNTHIIIVSNGYLYDALIDDIHTGDIVIGVDRAAYWLIMHNIIPDVAIGDFDSVTPDEMSVIVQKSKKVVQFAPEKDYTDTELAFVHAIRLKPASIALYGGSGTRLDHELGSLYLLEWCQKEGISGVFRNQTNEVRVIKRGRTILYKREGYRYVSIVPITNTIEISLSKFKYSIPKTILHRGQTIGISNEFIGPTAKVVVFTGKAFVVQSND